MRAKVLVVPVYQKHWLYYTWGEASPSELSAELQPWTTGATLQEKATLLGKTINQKASLENA